MGLVLRGRDPELGRELAVKLLLDHHRDRPDLVDRFVEEAQICGQLQHPGVVPVYDLGMLADDRPFFTMKLVKGQTLASLLARRGAEPDLPRFLSIFASVCQTMAYAHSRGVIHRDLKPSNVMVGPFGEVQVMDWGLAKVLPKDGPRKEVVAPPVNETVVATIRSMGESDLSQAGSVLGTPAYMAPEQARGETDAIDRRSDVFALGSILCEILTECRRSHRASRSRSFDRRRGRTRPRRWPGWSNMVRGPEAVTARRWPPPRLPGQSAARPGPLAGSKGGAGGGHGGQSRGRPQEARRRLCPFQPGLRVVYPGEAR